MTVYRATSEIPPLVQQALRLAAERGFTISCTDQVGRLLRVLAGTVDDGTVGEIGAGCGVGSAWMINGLRPSARFITVELDTERARATSELFTSFPNVEVLQGDWHQILARGPFDLLFVDVGQAKRDEPEAVLEAVRMGGLIVLDDLTPEEHLPDERRGQPDLVREFWLNQPGLAATEILLTPTTAAIVAQRLG